MLKISDVNAAKRLHTETSGTITRVYVYGEVVGTVIRVRNVPGLLPREVYEANSRARGVHGVRRSTLNAAVAEIVRR